MSSGWTATDNDCGQDYDVTDQQVTSPKDKGIRVTLDKASQQRVNIRKKMAYSFACELQVAYTLEYVSGLLLECKVQMDLNKKHFQYIYKWLTLCMQSANDSYLNI